MNPLGFLGTLLGSAATLFGGLTGQARQNSIAQQNIAMQQQFAQKGLQWRAADATAAQDATGINRLALLGVPTGSFSNVAGDNVLGDSIGKMGSDISRSMMAASDINERKNALEEQLVAAKIKNVDADTTRMLAEASKVVRTVGQPGTPPPYPRFPDANENSAKSIPLATTFVRLRSGEVVPVPTKDVSTQTQTLAAAPSSVVLASDLVREGGRQWNKELSKWAMPVVRPDMMRWISQDYSGFPWN